MEALKSIHDVGLLSAINADDLDVDDLDLGGMYGDFPQRADPHRSAANADADTQLEEENDNFDADFDPAMEASMHLRGDLVAQTMSMIEITCPILPCSLVISTPLLM